MGKRARTFLMKDWYFCLVVRILTARCMRPAETTTPTIFLACKAPAGMRLLIMLKL